MPSTTSKRSKAKKLDPESLKRLFESSEHLGPAMLIRTQEGDAIALRIGESLSETWQSDDIICFWPDGEHTALDGLEIEVLIEDIWRLGDERR